MAEIFSKSQLLDKRNFVNMFNTVFVRSSSEILKALLVYSVGRFMDKQKGAKPKPLRLNIKSGQLARYVQLPIGIQQQGTNLEYDTISAERTMRFPYLAIHEYGGTFPFRGGAHSFAGALASQPVQKRAMFARLTREGEYDKSKAMRGQGKASYTMPSRTFLRLAIADWQGHPAKMKPILKRNIANVFKDKIINIIIK